MTHASAPHTHTQSQMCFFLLFFFWGGGGTKKHPVVLVSVFFSACAIMCALHRAGTHLLEPIRPPISLSLTLSPSLSSGRRALRNTPLSHRHIGHSFRVGGFVLVCPTFICLKANTSQLKISDSHFETGTSPPWMNPSDHPNLAERTKHHHPAEQTPLGASCFFSRAARPGAAEVMHLVRRGHALLGGPLSRGAGSSASFRSLEGAPENDQPTGGFLGKQKRHG